MRNLERHSTDATDIEEILDEEDVQEDEGLNARDACRAAWGEWPFRSHIKPVSFVLLVSNIAFCVDCRYCHTWRPSFGDPW